MTDGSEHQHGVAAAHPTLDRGVVAPPPRHEIDDRRRVRADIDVESAPSPGICGGHERNSLDACGQRQAERRLRTQRPDERASGSSRFKALGLGPTVEKRVAAPRSAGHQRHRIARKRSSQDLGEPLDAVIAPHALDRTRPPADRQQPPGIAVVAGEGEPVHQAQRRRVSRRPASRCEPGALRRPQRWPVNTVGHDQGCFAPKRLTGLEWWVAAPRGVVLESPVPQRAALRRPVEVSGEALPGAPRRPRSPHRPRAPRAPGTH